VFAKQVDYGGHAARVRDSCPCDRIIKPFTRNETFGNRICQALD
jgi:hypothetical protein